MIEERSDKVAVPRWVAEGLWKPDVLTILEVMRGNIVLICFIACFLSFAWFGAKVSYWHLLAAIPLNWLQKKLSWSLRTSEEAIYLATKTSYRQHVFENALEKFRTRNPIMLHLLLAAFVLVPHGLFYSFSLKLPHVFVPYYAAYLIILFSSFAFYAYGRPETRHFDPDVSPEKYIKEFGTLGGNNMKYVMGRNIFYQLPVAIFLWFLISSKQGYSLGQMAGLYLSQFLVLRADQAIYNAKIFWLSLALHQKESS